MIEIVDVTNCDFKLGVVIEDNHMPLLSKEFIC